MVLQEISNACVDTKSRGIGVTYIMSDEWEQACIAEGHLNEKFGGLDLVYYHKVMHWVILQRLVGATLLVFANKQDLPGAMSADEIREVSQPCMLQYSS